MSPTLRAAAIFRSDTPSYFNRRAASTSRSVIFRDGPRVFPAARTRSKPALVRRLMLEVDLVSSTTG